MIETRRNNAYKKVNENPSVGVILCASKDEQVVEYAMSRSMSPTTVSQYTLKLIGKFFTTFRFSFIEQLLTFVFIPICPILCIWLPAFYIYSAIYLGVTGQIQALINMLILIAVVLLVLFIFVGILQGALLVILDYKKMGAKRRRDLINGIFLFPAFTIVYCVTITIGVFSKPKWIPVRRNPDEVKKDQTKQEK